MFKKIVLSVILLTGSLLTVDTAEAARHSSQTATALASVSYLYGDANITVWKVKQKNKRDFFMAIDDKQLKKWSIKKSKLKRGDKLIASGKNKMKIK